MKDLVVKVQKDHLEQVSHCRPVAALAELIWNALDADATEVVVSAEVDLTEVTRWIQITDNGHGMAPSEIPELFGHLGGSWKKKAEKTRADARLLHGKEGKGRFRAFALGREIEWNTVGEETDGQRYRTRIRTTADRMDHFRISDPEQAADAELGTIVTIRDVRENVPLIDNEGVRLELVERLAIYLTTYPGIALHIGGKKADPDVLVAGRYDYEVHPVISDGVTVDDLHLTVLEWSHELTRSLFLCDEAGFTLGRMPPGVQAPGFEFTAYLRSRTLRRLADEGALVLEDLHPVLSAIVDAGKGVMREHFQMREAEQAKSTVEEWKDAQIYPYEGEPTSPIEKVERKVFDVVALSVARTVPRFDQADHVSRQLSFRLLRHALEENPASLRKILGDVLELPKEQQDELAQILERTTLTAVVAAAKEVADRLDFLRGLEILLFRPDSRERLLERKELHRILVSETWIFGEQFHLSNDDQSLTDVLRKHLNLLRKESDDTVAENLSDDDLPEVLREDGSRGIVDLMLSRRIPQPDSRRREHLVVELKRPRQAVNGKIMAQIKDYAYAIARDERFRHTDTRWTLVVLTNRVTDQVVFEMEDQEKGILKVYDDPQMTVIVRTWGELLEECRARMTFFQDHLKYTADDESALDYLTATHQKYLPDLPGVRRVEAGSVGGE